MAETKLDEHRCETCRYRRKSGMCTMTSEAKEPGGLCDWWQKKYACSEATWGKE